MGEFVAQGVQTFIFQLPTGTAWLFLCHAPLVLDEVLAEVFRQGIAQRQNIQKLAGCGRGFFSTRMAGNRAFRSYGFADLAPGEIMA